MDAAAPDLGRQVMFCFSVFCELKESGGCGAAEMTHWKRVFAAQACGLEFQAPPPGKKQSMSVVSFNSWREWIW